MPTVNKNNAQRSSDNSQSQVTFRWGNSGPKFWAKETTQTALLSFLRKSDGDNPYYDLVLRIQNLDEKGKYLKTEDGNYDNGYFSFSGNDIARVNYQLEQMFPAADMDAGTIGGIIINHISAQSNNGSLFEIVAEEEGIFVYINYIKNGNVEQEYKHQLTNDQTLRYYDENGEETETTINADILALKSLFSSAYALVSGLADSVFEVNGFNINGRAESKTGGRVTGGLNRRVRSTLGGSKRAAMVSEDEGEDEETEAEAPAKKSGPVKKTTASKASKAASMQELLADDEEEDD